MGARADQPHHWTLHRAQGLQSPDIPAVRFWIDNRGIVLRPTVSVQAFSRRGGRDYCVRAGFPAEFRRLLRGTGSPRAALQVEPGCAFPRPVYDGVRRYYCRYEGVCLCALSVLCARGETSIAVDTVLGDESSVG